MARISKAEYGEIIENTEWEIRDELAREVESDAMINKLTREQRGDRQRATLIAKLAARNIRADQTGKLTKVRALSDASRYEFNAEGDPQVFPYDNASSECVRRAGQLDPADNSRDACYLREVAASVREHRESYRRGHNRGGRTCRGDLYRGLCH